MKAEQIHEALDGIVKVLVAKGIERPRAELWLKDGQRSNVSLWGKGVDPGSLNSDIWTRHGGSIAEQLDAAMEHAVALPDPAEREMAMFRRKLADLIDDGRNAGIDLEFLNPLSDTMKRLSENAITHEQEPVA